MSVAPQKHAASEAPAGPVPHAGGMRVGETLLLLTHDESLIEALRNVVSADSLSVVADESALANQLLSGQAGVVFIDAAAVSSRPGVAAQLTERLHAQFPDVVLVAAGDGAAQSELASLVTDGTVYRFVHKPVSAQRVKLFVDAAWRKRDGSASGLYPALSMPQVAHLEPMQRPVPWFAIAAAVIAIGMAAAWFLLRPSPQPEAEVAAPAAAPVAAKRVPQIIVTPATPEDLQAAADALHAARSGATDRLAVAAEEARAKARRRAADAAAAQLLAASRPPLPAPVVIPAPAHAPTVVADAPVVVTVRAAADTSISSSPEMVGPPSSTPPVGEAHDRLSVAAIILQRVYAPDPEFPELARQRDLSGYVDLEFTVQSDGGVADVTVLKSQPSGVFEQSAVAAVRQWRYRPLSRDGVPVSEHARLRLNFAYKEQPQR